MTQSPESRNELIEKADQNQKLTFEEQIDYLAYKGISFKLMNEFDAKNYLIENSYYYKVTAYRKNFQKSDGKYIDLDFLHLVDLATIDMRLRYLLIQLALDVEHTLKTKLIEYITSSNDEDGYSIISEYDDYLLNKIDNDSRLSEEEKENKKQSYITIKERIISKTYNQKIISKYSLESPPIWVLIENMTYGQLANFVTFYVDSQKYKSTELTLAANFLYISKNIRDTAAHSRPVLFDIINVVENNPKNVNMKRILKDYIIDKKIDKKLLHRHTNNLKLNDLCSLILLHDKYITSKYVRIARKKELRIILNRALYKKDKYSGDSCKKFGEITYILGKIIRNYC